MQNNSKLGLGFMRYDLGKNNQPLVDFAMNHGINYFETCYFYLNHQCENFAYDLLYKYPRDEYEICGKLSLGEAFLYNDYSYKDMYYSQLKKVPKNYFDYFLIQTLRPQAIRQVFLTDLYDFFQQEKKKGNIKEFGFSQQSDPSIFNLFMNKQWDIMQTPVNYFDWFLCKHDINYQLIKNTGAKIVAQAPYKGGLLVKDLPKTADKIILDKYGKSLSQVALDFVIDQKPDIILTGCSTLKTLQETYNNFNNYTSLQNNYEPLKQVLNLYQKENIIPCILCGKCQSVCQEGINIPFLFGGYNKTLNDPDRYFDLYSMSKYFFPEAINMCTECGACINVCPNHLNIPQLFNRVFELRP